MSQERYITSDLHLYHENIRNWCSESRPQDSVEEMNEAIIDNWNATVKKNDNVWVLGDVILGSQNINEDVKILSRLNGNLKLVLGNHDSASKIKLFYDYFSTIVGYKEFGHKNGIICSHYPVHPNQLENRYKLNIHGHMHNHSIPDNRYMNACLDYAPNNSKPVHWQNVIERLNELKGDENQTN